jgi:putative sigma-54 modulation protein
MKTNIKASGLSITDAVRDYVDEKLGGVEKFVNSKSGPVRMEVELERTTSHHHKGEIFRAEVNLKLGGNLLRAESTDVNLYSAIDLVREEIVRELKSSKEKKESLVRKGSRLLKGLIRGN